MTPVCTTETEETGTFTYETIHELCGVGVGIESFRVDSDVKESVWKWFGIWLVKETSPSES